MEGTNALDVRAVISAHNTLIHGAGAAAHDPKLRVLYGSQPGDGAAQSTIH